MPEEKQQYQKYSTIDLNSPINSSIKSNKIYYKVSFFFQRFFINHKIKH